MKQIRILMDMPITVEIVDKGVEEEIFTKVYSYFSYIDNKFSPFKKDSEITLINQHQVTTNNYSQDMKTIFQLAQISKKDTQGYFDIYHNGSYDPSGIVKGWAILNASRLIKAAGYKNFYVDAGGDIQVSGNNNTGEKWRVGIKNPFNQRQIIKVLVIKDKGVVTSGTYIRGQHIYDPKNDGKEITDIVSLTVVGPNVYEADRFATAAFAMGKNGIVFLEQKKGLEGYSIDKDGIATYTSGFNKYVASI